MNEMKEYTQRNRLSLAIVIDFKTLFGLSNKLVCVKYVLEITKST